MPSRWQRSRTEFTSFPYPPGGLIGNPSDFREDRKGSRSLGGHEPPPGGLKSAPALGLTFRWERSSYPARARKPTTRAHARSPRPFSQPGGLERGLTRGQPDSSRRGGKPRSPRTGISGASPAWAPLLRVVRADDPSSDPKPGLRDDRPPARTLCPSCRRPPPAAAQRRASAPAAGPGKLSNGPLPPPRGRGVRGGLAGPIPGAPATGRFTGDFRQEREGPAAAAAGGPRGASDPRPPRPAPRPRRRDGSLRGAH